MGVLKITYDSAKKSVLNNLFSHVCCTKFLSSQSIGYNGTIIVFCQENSQSLQCDIKNIEKSTFIKIKF